MQLLPLFDFGCIISGPRTFLPSLGFSWGRGGLFSKRVSSPFCGLYSYNAFLFRELYAILFIADRLAASYERLRVGGRSFCARSF